MYGLASLRSPVAVFFFRNPRNRIEILLFSGDIDNLAIALMPRIAAGSWETAFKSDRPRGGPQFPFRG